MGYNAALEQAINLPNIVSIGTEETFFPLPCGVDQRISIPFFVARAGATEQRVTFLQVKEVDYLAEDIVEDANQCLLQMNGDDLTGRYIGIQDSMGTYFFSKVTGVDGQMVSFENAYELGNAKQDNKVFIFHLPDEGGNQSFPLRAEELELYTSGCPGVVLAEQIGYPLILHISNNNDETVEFHGGTIAYISK